MCSLSKQFVFPNRTSDVPVSAGQTGAVNKAMKSLARAEDISQVNKLYRQIPSCIPVQGEARKELILVRVTGQED